MEIAIITDTHAGIRNDAQVFLDVQDKFYRDVFFPEIDRRNIKHVLHLGDYFDRRKFINFNTLSCNHKSFIQPLIERELELTVIIGNHDTTFKNTNTPNSPTQLLSWVPKIRIIHEHPQEITIGQTRIGLVPWICDENREHITRYLERNSAPDIIMGHFEIAGFEMFKGQVCEHGLSRDFFSKFDLVLSGHFHHKSTIGNITYLGSPHQATWADYDDPRGFHIFDTNTLGLEFIENTDHVFIKFSYDDTNMTLDEVVNEDFSYCKDRFVRVLIEKKNDPALFEKVIQRIQQENPADLSLVEDYNILRDTSDDAGIDMGKETIGIVEDYIQDLSVENKDKLKAYFKSLYLESAELIV